MTAPLKPESRMKICPNLGYATAKPDRHLVRLAAALGYEDVHQLCLSLSEATGDPVQVVDVVLWRYSERCGQLRHTRTQMQSRVSRAVSSPVAI